MSQFQNAIIRGAGLTIGRMLVQGAVNLTESAIEASIAKARMIEFAMSNSRINKMINTSIFDMLNDSIFSTRTNWHNEILKLEKVPRLSKATIVWMSIWLFFAIWVGLAEIFGDPSHPGSAGMEYVFFAFIGFASVSFIIGTVKYKSRKSKNSLKIEEIYKTDEIYRTEMSALEKSLNEILDYITQNYGKEMADNFEYRRPVNNMPFQYFETFFGNADATEQTVKDGSTFDTLVYGTSKQAGDWFRFKDGNLVEYVIK